MSGETNLKTLLANMRPMLRDDVYVFASLPHIVPVPHGIDPLMTYREEEGTTLILEEHAAERSGLASGFRSRLITLNVHSSLEAVGFLAAITARLAQAGMGVNPVSAFFHDHLFVPEARADEALCLLHELARENAI